MDSEVGTGSPETLPAGRLLPVPRTMDALGALAANVAGDLNHLLTITLLCLDRLAAHIPPGSPGCAELDELLVVSRRFDALGRKLLIASLHEPCEIDAFDLGAAIRESLGTVRPLVGPGIELRVKIAPEQMVIRADRAQFEHSLFNLVRNSRDATQAGGRITITARLDATGTTCKPGEGARYGPCALLTVTDTGTGIAPEVLPRVFEPFFTTKPRKEAAGLGLTSVYATMRQAGGCVSVESEPGKGTSFELCFPLAENPVSGGGR